MLVLPQTSSDALKPLFKPVAQVFHNFWAHNLLQILINTYNYVYYEIFLLTL
jgi:hypothetical protein